MVYDQDIYYRYFYSLYISIYLTTGHDIAPIGFVQVSISSIGLFLGAIINANIFGELAVLVQQLNRKESAFMLKLTKTAETIKKLRVYPGLESRIREFII